jgi:hypothetical protein
MFNTRTTIIVTKIKGTNYKITITSRLMLQSQSRYMMTNMSTAFFSEGVRRYLSHQIDQIMLRSDVRVNAQGDLTHNGTNLLNTMVNLLYETNKFRHGQYARGQKFFFVYYQVLA